MNIYAVILMFICIAVYLICAAIIAFDLKQIRKEVQKNGLQEKTNIKTKKEKTLNLHETAIKKWRNMGVNNEHNSTD